MLCVGLGIKTFGPLYTMYDLQSICIVTATHDGQPLRSLSLDLRPRSDSVYRVHPSWSGNLADHHFAALPAHQVDAQVAAFILQDLYQQGYVDREKVENLATDKSPDIVRTLAASILTVTKQAHWVIPFLVTQLPVTAALLSTHVVDLAAFDYAAQLDLPLTDSYPFVGTCERGYVNLFQQVSAYVARWASIVQEHNKPTSKGGMDTVTV